MALLIIGAVTIGIFGVISLFSREMLLKLGEMMNRPITTVDDKLRKIRIPLGIVMLIVAVWVIMVAFNYPQLWYLHIIGIIILFFGLLYLFVPDWLSILSAFMDQVMLSTDELYIGTRKTIGIILVLGSIYILYSVFLLTR